MATPIENVLQLGFRFEPTPLDAVGYYLPRLIAGELMHAAIRPYIHDADVYACAPGVLVGQFQPTPGKDDRFFFTTVERQKSRTGKDVRYVRVAGPGSWSLQRSDDIKDANSVKVGEIRKLRYKYNNGGVATDWLMEEYSCACSVKDAVVAGDKERVFCRIYMSPNAGANSVARQESAAFFAKKRPAPPIANTPCPKRIRGAPVAPIRPPPPAGCSTSFPSPRPSTSASSFASPRRCTPQIGMVPMMQPGRSPAPATPRPSQQLKSSVAYHILEPALRPSVPAPPVKQQPLTPRPGPAPAALLPVPFSSPDHLLPTEDPAEAEDDFDDLINHIECSLPTTEADDDMAQFVSSLNDILASS